MAAWKICSLRASIRADASTVLSSCAPIPLYSALTPLALAICTIAASSDDDELRGSWGPAAWIATWWVSSTRRAVQKCRI
jgi:hypothetical protein